MKAKITHVQSGITKWYLKDVAPLGWKAMLATPLVKLGVANALNKHADIVSTLSDECGEIDIDALRKDYAEIINKAGSIELFGVKFNIQDLDSLYATIKAEVPPQSGAVKAKE